MNKGIEDLRSASTSTTAYSFVGGTGSAGDTIAARADSTCQSLETWKTMWPRRRKPVRQGSDATGAAFTAAPA